MDHSTSSKTPSFLGVGTNPAPPRFPRGGGRSGPARLSWGCRPLRPRLGFPGVRPLRPRPALSGVRPLRPVLVSPGCGCSGLSIFLGSQVSLRHIPTLVSRVHTKDTRLHGKSAQEPRRPPCPQALTLHFREDPAADHVVPWGRGRLGKRLRLPTGAKPMGRPCFLPDAPGGRGSRNQPSCPEPPCHSHSRRQTPCH